MRTRATIYATPSLRALDPRTDYHTPHTMDTPTTPATPAAPAWAHLNTDACQYYGGLLDAQMVVTRTKSGVRVQLASADERVLREMHMLAPISRETITRRPGKKDTCVGLLAGDAARRVLEFAAEWCVVKKDLAVAALAALDDPDVVIPGVEVPDAPDVTLGWASGFFDVRGEVTPPAPAPAPAPAPEPAAEAEASADKPRAKAVRARRATVRIILPKAEKPLVPSIQKVLGGKVRKSSPCRIVFTDVPVFLDTVRAHLRVRRMDLESIAA